MNMNKVRTSTHMFAKLILLTLTFIYQFSSANAKEHVDIPDYINGADEEFTLENCLWTSPEIDESTFLDLIITNQEMTSSYDRTIDSTYRIVNRFHVVRRANGSGGLDEELIPALMRDLNYGYRNTPFVFVQDPDIVYVDNDTYYQDFPTFSSAFDMLTANFENGVMSWYIVPCVSGCTSDAGTWIGPASQVRGILMGYTATGSPARMVTPVHEMGHIFQIHHPYISNAFGTECTSGSNCATAGDLVCDTPASPIIFSANTTATGIYFGNQQGPCVGDPVYDPNPRLYMEAGWEAGHILRNEFSQGQINRAIKFTEAAAGSRLSVNDLVGPNRPDILVDCDNNDMDDVNEILAGIQPDVNQDLVPDGCQVFPQTGDLIVSGQNSGRDNRLRYFDADTGDWRGDLWNGMTWAHQVRMGPDGLLYMARLTLIQRISLETGRTVDNFIDGVLEGAGTFVDLLFEPSGNILVLDIVSANVRRYNGITGEYMGDFIGTNSLSGFSPKYMEYGPDGNLYVVGNGGSGNRVKRFDGTTGQVMSDFVAAGNGGLGAGQGLVFHDDGFLYVSNGVGNNILRYDDTTGAFDKTFVTTAANGGLNNPHSLRFGPDGNLYVASRNTNSVKRYDGVSGAYIDDFVAPNSGGSPGTGGLNQPAGLVFVPENVTDPKPQPEQDTSAITGSWYDPLSSGEGFMLHSVNNDLAVGYFYGYDENGDRLWLIGVSEGPFIWNEPALFEAQVVEGGSFTEFDTENIVNSDWGTFEITQLDCDSASLDLNGTLGEKTLQLIRLAKVAGSKCAGETLAQATDSVTGSWYDPLTSGQGFAVHKISDDRGALYFYGYNDEGEHLWLIGVWEEELVFGEQVIIELDQASGGTFDLVDPADIKIEPWGTLRLRFDDCESGWAKLEGLDGSQELDLALLAGSLGLDCPAPKE